MDIQWTIALAGLIVGFVIGMTGMGGGALMTPILVLIFSVKPTAAISSDLVSSLIMKPFGAAIHMRGGTVDWRLVRWLTVGSVPGAIGGVFIIQYAGDSAGLQDRVETALGVALLLAAAAIVVRLVFDSRRTARQGTEPAEPVGTLPVKSVPTALVGMIGGIMVGMTSTGSGTVIICCLMLLYPVLRLKRLVGTDLVQAIPLVGAAAVTHAAFGQFQLGLTTSLVIGSVPGIILGARLSSRAPDLLVRPLMVLVLTGSALKLLGVGTTPLGVTLAVLAVVGLPAWGLYDAWLQPSDRWASTGHDRRRILTLQAVGLPIGVGAAAAVVYFSRLRPGLLTPPEHEPLAAAA